VLRKNKRRYSQHTTLLLYSHTVAFLVTMFALSDVEASNSQLSTSLPAGLVAVFVRATSGIGEYTMKAFAQRTDSPKIYVVGRSQDAANRILAECKELNPRGQYTFIRSDVALLKNVDDVCQQILAKEKSINLLFQTQGTIRLDSK
jgi:NADP-dependent 3-hydroxy acid dehydrogenase YdfG